MQSTNLQRALESHSCNKTLNLGTCKESPTPAGEEKAFPDILLLTPRSSRDGSLSEGLSRSKTSSLPRDLSRTCPDPPGDVTPQGHTLPGEFCSCFPAAKFCIRQLDTGEKMRLRDDVLFICTKLQTNNKK